MFYVWINIWRTILRYIVIGSIFKCITIRIWNSSNNNLYKTSNIPSCAESGEWRVPCRGWAAAHCLRCSHHVMKLSRHQQLHGCQAWYSYHYQTHGLQASDHSINKVRKLATAAESMDHSTGWFAEARMGCVVATHYHTWDLHLSENAMLCSRPPWNLLLLCMCTSSAL